MFEICYVSSANEKYKTPALVQLLSQARANNETNDITGLLLYDGAGTFVQALEGDKKKVEALFSKIKNDARHKRVNVLGEREVPERSFGNWSMGFRLLNHPEITNMKGFSDFLNVPPDKWNSFAKEAPGFAMKMLYYFREQAKTEAEDQHNI